MLAETGQPGVDEARIGGQQRVGAQSQLLHDARPERLHQHVGRGAQPSHHLSADESTRKCPTSPASSLTGFVPPTRLPN